MAGEAGGVSSSHARALADRLNDALPQTQCTRCGYPDCRSYAEAVADGEAINRCPPGGRAGVERLAMLTGRPVADLDPACGAEGPRRLAVIDEASCIGCTLCLKACPVDCIVGGPKFMHTVIAELCTGCELCLPPCPVDCIALVDTGSAATGWQAWSNEQAADARGRHDAHRRREAEEADAEARRLAPTPGSAVAAALARARAARAG